jgi:type I restriction enzyme R subunit
MSKDLFLEEFIRRIGAFGWEDGAKYVTIDRYAALTTPILESVLRDRVKAINQEELGKLPSPSRDKAVDEALTRLKNEVDLVQILDFIRRGVPVTVGTGRGSASLILKVIDYENLSNNKFFYLRRVRFREVGGSIIEPDFILYVNGIPIVVVEIRNKNRIGSYREALEKLRRYEEDAPSLFKYVQLGLAIGDDEFYRPTLPGYIKSRRDAYRWVVKETSRSDVTRLLEPRVLLDFLRYYIQYVMDEGGVLTKIVARYNQYNATEAVMRRSEEHLKRPGGKNAGLVWHWLGSGKTFTMFFSALKFLDRYYDKSPIVFIVVDRTELEDQIGRVLRAIRDQRFKLLFQRVESIEQLHDILRTIKRAELDPKIALQPKVYLVTIQKFMRGSEEVAGIESLLTELGNMYLEYL